MQVIFNQPTGICFSYHISRRLVKPMFEDRTLACKECGVEFVFSAAEQSFYAEKGFQNDPSRCPACRAARKQSRNDSRPAREMFTVICSGCGIETQVPFNPTAGRPVYCRDCFQASKRNY